MNTSASPYRIINKIFIAILCGMLIYCFLYPYFDIQIPSSCEGRPLVYCKSRGLSRAFSEIVRLNIIGAIGYNKHSITIFAFFIYQLLTRIILNKLLLPLNHKYLLTLDICISTTFFIYAFYPLVTV